jgi:hypothetical protein
MRDQMGILLEVISQFQLYMLPTIIGVAVMHIRPRQGRLLIQIKETGCAWPEDLPSLRRENTAVADQRYDAASVPKIVLQAVGSEAIAGPAAERPT